MILLYAINPPVVQCKQKENEMTKPSPNFYYVLLISLVVAAGD